MGSAKKKLKLTSRDISVAVKKAIKKDAKDRARVIALQTEMSLQQACNNGDLLCELDRNKICRQTECNHRKGGMLRTRPILYGEDATTAIAERVVFPTQGTDHQFAVIKHQMMNFDIWVHCLRCGKWWKPPIRANYATETQFILACVEYQKAVEFPTNNVMSSSVLVRFKKPNGSEKYRKLVSNS